MKASTCNLKALGERMRSAREWAELSRPLFVEKFGGSVRTLENAEGGRNEPGACLIASFSSLGINANWLLTGEGPMLLADMKQQALAGTLDPERLQASIQAVDEGLANSDRVMKPNKKAELVLAVYDLMQEPSVTKERVLRLVKLAA